MKKGTPMNKIDNEIETLNVDELDVEELERRLELAFIGGYDDDDLGGNCNGINYGTT